MNEPKSLREDRYILKDRLGEGGMATVYRAFDSRLQVWRAVKLLLPEYSRKKKIRERFHNEARTMANLEHPHIVRVYDVDRDGDHEYIVMELVEGGSLVDWLERHGAMPPRMALDVIVEMCRAVEFAHGRGVVHRDIKPHNIMVDRAGVCRLTDFGIARAGDTDASLTKTGAVMGTWGYMAPEQRSDAKHVDERADVYALAATLYSLVTDQTPMDMFAAGHDPSMLEAVPDPLRPILVQATHYKKQERYGSVHELATALLGARDALPANPDGAPPLVGDVSDLPPPEPEPLRPRGVVPAPMGDGGETLVADDAERSGQHTALPPEPDESPIAVSGQQRAVWSPSDPDHDPEPALVGQGTRWAPVAFGALLVLGGAAAVAALTMGGGPPLPEPAPSPVAIVQEPVEPVAGGDAAPAEAAPAEPSQDEPVRPVARDPEVVSTAPAPDPVRPALPPRRPAPEPEPEPAGDAAPDVAAPAPAAPAVAPAPEPEPAQEFRAVEVDTSVVLGDELLVRARTAVKSAPLVFYRPKGTAQWFSKRMTFALGAWSAKVPVDETFSQGVEWYLASEGVTYGSQSVPRLTEVRSP